MVTRYFTAEGVTTVIFDSYLILVTKPHRTYRLFENVLNWLSIGGKRMQTINPAALKEAIRRDLTLSSSHAVTICEKLVSREVKIERVYAVSNYERISECCNRKRIGPMSRRDPGFECSRSTSAK